MNEINRKYLIREFGEAITDYMDKIIWIDTESFTQRCLIENFGFNSQLLKSIRCNVVNGGYGLIDVRFFAKNKSRGFQLQYISLKDLKKLCELTTYLYDWEREEAVSIKPESINLTTNNFESWRYWDELDIYRHAEIISIHKLFEWLEKEILHQVTDDLERDKLQNILNSTAIKSDFKSKLGNEITLYNITDDNNENCGFAPFIFAGNEFLIVAAKRWGL